MQTPEKGIPKGIIAAVATAGIAAAAVGGYALTRESAPTTPPPPDHTAAATSPSPDKTVIVTPTRKVEVTVTPIPTPTPTEKPKTLPDVISKETVEFVILPPAEIQKMEQESSQFKIPLPDILNKPGIYLKEVTTKTGIKALAIVAVQKGEFIYDLPNLADGKVSRMVIGNATFAFIYLNTDKGEPLVYVFPAPAKSTLKVGDNVSVDQIVASLSYSPDNTTWQNYLKSQFVDAPDTTLAMIGAEKDVTRNNILTTSDQRVILASSK